MYCSNWSHYNVCPRKQTVKRQKGFDLLFSKMNVFQLLHRRFGISSTFFMAHPTQAIVVSSIFSLNFFLRRIGRGLERWQPGAHPDQPSLEGAVHRLLRVPRPGAGGRQDHRLLAHGQGDVHR